MNIKKNSILLGIAVLSFLFSGIAFAAGNATSEYWFQEGNDWKIKDAAGNLIKDSWVCDDKNNQNRDSNWYLMNANGIMYEGVINDNGHYYLLDPNHNGTYGMMISGSSSFTYNGVTLRLETAHNGYFGEIINTEQVPRLGLNITTVNTSGKPIYYTSEFAGSHTGSGNADSQNAAAAAGDHFSYIQGTWKLSYMLNAGEFTVHPLEIIAEVTGDTMKLSNGKTHTLTDNTDNDKKDRSVFPATFIIGGKDTVDYAVLQGTPTLYVDYYYENKTYVFTR